MARTFDHHLDVMLPCALCQLPESVQFAELRFIIGVIDGAGPKTITQAERYVVSLHDFANVVKMCVEEFSRWWARHHLAMMEPPRDTIPVTRFAVKRDPRQPDASMQRK